MSLTEVGDMQVGCDRETKTALVTRVVRAQDVLLIATIACGLALPAAGSAEERLIDTERSTVTVRVFKSGLFRAFADNHIIQAPLAEGSLDDPPTFRS